jgi:hypothetical protein
MLLGPQFTIDHLKRASKSFRRMFRYLAVFGFVLGFCQIALTIHIFRNNKRQTPNHASGADGAKTLVQR